MYILFQQHELAEMQSLMDAQDGGEGGVAPLSRGPNPYLGGDRCLLCRCERPDPPKLSASPPQENGRPSNHIDCSFFLCKILKYNFS